jgi:hypothetical protein
MYILQVKVKPAIIKKFGNFKVEEIQAVFER